MTNMDLFYSDEQYREYCDELAGDGFSNEYQRASFQSKLENPPHNERAEAERLTKAGKFVVVCVAPYYCRITDAIIGEHFTIVAAYDERDPAESHAWSYHERVCDDASCFVYRLPAPAAPAQPTVEDDLPF
jgi:hypothetical protein